MTTVTHRSHNFWACHSAHDAESILAYVLDSRLRGNDIEARLVRALNQELLHQLGVVDPHNEEGGCRRLAFFDVDKEGPVEVETSYTCC